MGRGGQLLRGRDGQPGQAQRGHGGEGQRVDFLRGFHRWFPLLGMGAGQARRTPSGAGMAACATVMGVERVRDMIIGICYCGFDY